MTYSDDQAAHDRAYIGGISYTRIPSTPLPDVRRQRAEWNYKRAAEDSELRDGIPVERNYKMTYTRDYNIPSPAELRQQITECQQQISFYEEQLRRLESFRGDKSAFKLNLRNAQRRLEQLKKELAEY